MPKRAQGVYPDGRGRWYFKVTLGTDALTGKRVQITKRLPHGCRGRPGTA